MTLLSIRHVPGDQLLFQVSRPDGKSADPTPVPSPASFPVEGRPDTNLLRELRWYLEDFLTYPFSPETEHAERVLAALRAWGGTAFQSLFGTGSAGLFFHEATREGYHALHLQVWSDDPRVLAWPWEALRDPEAHILGHTSEIERCLDHVKDPLPIPEDLPQDRVNILLVTARPKGERDVAYRSVSRRLVELVAKKNLPAHVHVLRPPTLQRLEEHLRERPHFYHLLHFDGHGAYGAHPAAHAHGSCFQGEGCLVFETQDGKEDLVRAETLSARSSGATSCSSGWPRTSS